MRCKARRRRDVHTLPGAATPQRAQFDPALRVEAGRGVCGVVGLGKGLPLPASSALHPSTSGLNAIRRMIENRP